MSRSTTEGRLRDFLHAAIVPVEKDGSLRIVDAGVSASLTYALAWIRTPQEAEEVLRTAPPELDPLIRGELVLRTELGRGGP